MKKQTGIGLIEALITLLFVVFITLALAKHQGVSLTSFSVSSNKAEAVRLADQVISALELTPKQAGEASSGFDVVAGIATSFTRKWTITPVPGAPAVDVTVTTAWKERNGKEEKTVTTKRVFVQAKDEQVKVSQAEVTDATIIDPSAKDKELAEKENAKNKGLLLEIKGSFQYTGSAGSGTDVEVGITEGGACSTGGGGYSCTVPPGWKGTIEFSSSSPDVKIAPSFASYAGVIASDSSSTVFVFQR